VRPCTPGLGLGCISFDVKHHIRRPTSTWAVRHAAGSGHMGGYQLPSVATLNIAR